jgi:hypothetical protein
MSSLQREGFEIIPKFLPERTILELTVSLDEVSATRSRAGMRNALRVPDVHCLAKDEKLIALARRALGDKAIPFRATLFDKSAEWYGTRTPPCLCASEKTCQAGVRGR